MKKAFTILLCILLLLPLSAGANVYSPVDYTMDRKLISQIRTGGYEGTVTVGTRGESMGYPFDTLFALLRPLDQAVITFNGTGEKNVGKHNDVRLTAARGGETLTDLRLQVSPELWAFSSDTLLKGQFFAFDPSAFRTMFLELNEIPAELRAFFTARGSVFPAALSEYEEELGFFMAEYCTVGIEDGCSVLTYRVPAKALINECADLLSRVLSRPAARAALCTYLEGTGLEALMTAENAALLPAAVRMLKLSGDLVLIRRFDARAMEIETEAELPMPAEGAVSRVLIRIRPGETGTMLDVTAEYPEGDLVRFSCLQEQNTYTGVFAVRSAARALDEAFDYSLILTEKNVNYDRVEDKVSQRFGFLLTLTPMEGSLSHSFTAEGQVTLTSQKKEDKPTFAAGTCVLEDETAGSAVTFDLNGKTKAAAVPGIIDAAAVTRADQLPTEALRQWLQEILEAYEAAVPQL